MGEFVVRKLDDEQLRLCRFWLDEVAKSIEVSDFQVDFFDSIYNQFNSRGTLSHKQFDSLKRIYERVTG